MSKGCKICDAPEHAEVINGFLVRGITYASIARMLAMQGFKVTPATISTHDKHRMPDAPATGLTNKRDLATLVRDKVYAVVNEDDFDVMDRRFANGMRTGLQAQQMLDRREERKAPTTDVAVALIRAFTRQVDLPALPDPNVIEGEAHEID